MGIGQGETQVTPLQLARALGGIASDGHFVRPHVVMPDQLPADFRQAVLDSFPGSGDKDVPLNPGHLGDHHRRHGCRHHHRHGGGLAY